MTKIKVRGVWGGTVGKESGNKSEDSYRKGNRKTETVKNEPFLIKDRGFWGSDAQRGSSARLRKPVWANVGNPSGDRWLRETSTNRKEVSRKPRLEGSGEAPWVKKFKKRRGGSSTFPRPDFWGRRGENIEGGMNEFIPERDEENEWKQC